MSFPQATLTKTFPFSASYQKKGKFHAHNYVLAVTTDAVDEEAETRLERQIHDALIARIASRDLGLHVNFLKDSDLTDRSLLEAFCPLIRKAIAPWPLYTLALERGRGARTELIVETSA